MSTAAVTTVVDTVLDPGLDPVEPAETTIRIRPLVSLSPAGVRALRRDVHASVHEAVDGHGAADRPDAGPVEPSPDGDRQGTPLRLVDDFGPVLTRPDSLPDPHLWAGRVGVALFEVAIGARPATQVMRWLSPDVHDSLVRRSSRAHRAGRATRRPVRLRRVRAALVPGDAAIVEACVVFDDHRRVRVMALRMEGLDGRWLVTACEIG